MASNKTIMRLKIEIATLQEWKCHWCSQPMISQYGFRNTATVEHMIPRCEGGSNERHNLTAACYRCNNDRGSQNATRFAEFAKNLPIDTRSICDATKSKCERPAVIHSREDSRMARAAVLEGIDNPFEEGSRRHRFYEYHKNRLIAINNIDDDFLDIVPADELKSIIYESHDNSSYIIDFNGLGFYVLLIIICKLHELLTAMKAPVENRVENPNWKFSYSKEDGLGPGLSGIWQNRS